jgi:uncharacterized protein (TIGR00369 family)
MPNFSSKRTMPTSPQQPATNTSTRAAWMPEPAMRDLPALRRFFASAPFMADLGVEPICFDDGRLVTSMMLEERLFQHSGVVHAGAMASMADHTMGALAQAMAPAEHLILTAEFKISLLRGARGQRLECEGLMVKPGRLVMFTEAEVFAIDGDTRTAVARATATMAVLQRPSQPDLSGLRR